MSATVDEIAAEAAAVHNLSQQQMEVVGEELARLDDLFENHDHQNTDEAAHLTAYTNHSEATEAYLSDNPDGSGPVEVDVFVDVIAADVVQQYPTSEGDNTPPPSLTDEPVVEPQPNARVEYLAPMEQPTPVVSTQGEPYWDPRVRRWRAS